MTTSTTHVRSWYRPMRARRPDEEHRVATPLELFFDLCFVVAVAQASGSLHHDLAENHLGHAVSSYLMVFFAIWWAWMNFTWFASAYDTDDDVYRVTILVQIAGALILAAGVPRAFSEADFTTITYGYVVMRLAAIVNWLRAAAGDPERRSTATAYAAGVFVVQLGWLLRLALPDGLTLPAFFVLVLAEVLVPVVAERLGKTSFHPHHIAERYQLFTLIVLGEAILSISVAIQSGVDAGNPELWWLAAAGAVIVFALWWLYFDRPGQLPPGSLRGSLFWGYGHYLIFAAIAAVGAGLAVAVDHDLRVAHVSGRTAGYAVAVPVAVYLLTLWALHLHWKRGIDLVLFPIAALLALVAPWLPAPVPVLAGLLFVLVAATLLLRHRGAADRTA
ncbi:low temperature requirement protein A [Micromonospora inositola]|uniref:Low temperature requirement protein LtrA n=1 Tax=Micromonospora inositola TaxID=47865 RepID=A0A1C5JL21_9ACTN|nr:low temperature requirement protein A [Micromonospora inositola]SCG71247.1 Low temperature requirement protein LtrA [Micromonospora inositola]